jgi:hypothetical protein
MSPLNQKIINESVVAENLVHLNMLNWRSVSGGLGVF